MDACRAALSLCPWMDGSRAMQEQLPRERMAACPPKSIHFQGAEGHTYGPALFLDTSFWQKKKYFAHLLVNNYVVGEVLVCETTAQYKIKHY